MGDELIHYGILGMKWGRRKSRTQSSTNNKKLQRRAKTKRILKNAFSISVSAAMLALSLRNIAQTKASYINSGKQYAQSFMKKNSSKKMSDFEEKSWADYAWEEVEKG